MLVIYLVSLAVVRYYNFSENVSKDIDSSVASASLGLVQ